MTGPAWTLVPLMALQLRAFAGVAAVWVFFATAAVAGAAVGLAAARAARAPDLSRKQQRRGQRRSTLGEQTIAGRDPAYHPRGPHRTESSAPGSSETPHGALDGLPSDQPHSHNGCGTGI